MCAAPADKARSRATRIARVADWLTYLYLGVVVGCWVLSRLVGDRWWVGAALLYAPPMIYLLPGLGMWVLVQALRASVAVRRARIGVALAAVLLLDVQLPFPRAGFPWGRPRVRILVQNLDGGIGGFAAIRAQIQRSAPDLIVFVEAGPHTHFGLMRGDLAAFLEGWSIARGADVFLASRWPMLERERTPLRPDEPEDDPSVYREVVRATIRAPFGRFHLLGAHYRKFGPGYVPGAGLRGLPRDLRHTTRLAREQSAVLVRTVRALTGPVVLGADLNLPPGGRAYDRLCPRLEDAFTAAGWGLGQTWPGRFPTHRIDYILYSRDWVANSCIVGDPGGSDHRPVVAELILRVSPTPGSTSVSAGRTDGGKGASGSPAPRPRVRPSSAGSDSSPRSPRISL